ncbi:hypothetical protein [Brevibacillus porteri]|uniref:hypothetical protein n=1 Tax=Brevibacillus porteri TaxID=2126350 RepID=UPI00362B2632
MIVFNMNDNARVKLTELGFTILEANKYYPKPDDEGYLTLPLWELMKLFGEHLFLGCKVPFETNIQLLSRE